MPLHGDPGQGYFPTAYPTKLKPGLSQELVWGSRNRTLPPRAIFYKRLPQLDSVSGCKPYGIVLLGPGGGEVTAAAR